jgi:hypothetical protein
MTVLTVNINNICIGVTTWLSTIRPNSSAQRVAEIYPTFRTINTLKCPTVPSAYKMCPVTPSVEILMAAAARGMSR